MKLESVASYLNQEAKFPNKDVVINQLCIDSRKISHGDLFIALRGPNFDGHDYILSAIDKGAVAIVSEKKIDGLAAPIFIVNNSLDALTEIARAHRLQFDLPTIAITGSCGKTTVKEMLTAILSQSADVLSTYGNLNNHIGVPLTIARLNSHHQYAIFELGASIPGDISHTVQLVRPDVALINNISEAHLEGLGSLDGVANTKAGIFDYFQYHHGTAVLNADDAYFASLSKRVHGSQLCRYSMHTTQADVYATDISIDAFARACFKLHIGSESVRCQLPIPGYHNIANALAATACAHAVGIALDKIQTGLANAYTVSGRMTYKTGINNALVIDDSYNANAASVSAAIEVLARFAGQTILVMGDMGELGAYAVQQHRKVGDFAKSKGITKVLTCGELSRHTQQAFGAGGQHFENQEDLINQLSKLIDSSTTIVVKGSRSAHMEHVVDAIVKS